MCRSFFQVKDIVKEAGKAGLPTMIHVNASKELAVSWMKITFAVGENSWSAAALKWLAVIFTFWVEAPPHLDFFKVVFARVCLDFTDGIEACSSNQKKILDKFIAFCQPQD